MRTQPTTDNHRLAWSRASSLAPETKHNQSACLFHFDARPEDKLGQLVKESDTRAIMAREHSHGIRPFIFRSARPETWEGDGAQRWALVRTQASLVRRVIK